MLALAVCAVAVIIAPIIWVCSTAVAYILWVIATLMIRLTISSRCIASSGVAIPALLISYICHMCMHLSRTPAAHLLLCVVDCNR